MRKTSMILLAIILLLLVAGCSRYTGKDVTDFTKKYGKPGNKIWKQMHRLFEIERAESKVKIEQRWWTKYKGDDVFRVYCNVLKDGELWYEFEWEADMKTKNLTAISDEAGMFVYKKSTGGYRKGSK
ncbi:MAG: hypothetical protein K8S56_11000 [Candidatus Cloacimonetes bacterium]|nr:hypothetical protein [Candidatus Cloacimonadota bacterium]